MNEYRVIRSSRRSVALEVKRNCDVWVRAPYYMPDDAIERFVAEHEAWIKEAVRKQKERLERYPDPDAAETELLKKKAKEILPSKVEYFSAKTGLKPSAVKITSAKTRFGSCSGKNSICFSYILMRYPDDVIDYVVLHEIAHIKHHNHSKAFWRYIESFMPDYMERRKKLK